MPRCEACCGEVISTGWPWKNRLAAVEGEVAGERLDHGGLAGAVVADDGDDLARVDVEVGVVEGSYVPEAA